MKLAALPNVVLGARSFSMESPLPPATCLSRLRQAVPEDEGWFGTRPVTGSVESQGAMLQMRGSRNNAFHPVLRLRWQAEGAGTRLHCRVVMGPLGIGSTALLVGVGLLACLFAWGQALTGHVVRADLVKSILLPPGMLVVFLALSAGARRLARGDDDRLLEFLASTMDAEQWQSEEKA